MDEVIPVLVVALEVLLLLAGMVMVIVLVSLLLFDFRDEVRMRTTKEGDDGT